MKRREKLVDFVVREFIREAELQNFSLARSKEEVKQKLKKDVLALLKKENQRKNNSAYRNLYSFGSL